LKKCISKPHLTIIEACKLWLCSVRFSKKLPQQYSKYFKPLLGIVIVLISFSLSSAYAQSNTKVKPVEEKLTAKKEVEEKTTGKPAERALLKKEPAKLKDTVSYTLPKPANAGVKKTFATFKDTTRSVTSGKKNVSDNTTTTNSKIAFKNSTTFNPSSAQKTNGSNNNSAISVNTKKPGPSSIISSTHTPANASAKVPAKSQDTVVAGTRNVKSQSSNTTLSSATTIRVQSDTSLVRVAVFAPLFIDNAFNGGSYTLGKSNLPKNILQGLEFYNGVMMAVDSLSKTGLKAEISIYDTKASTESLAQILSASPLNNVGLMIAAITSTLELKQFSQFAASKNVPLISATFPSAFGVTSNPNFVLLNSSFPTHVEGLYKYLQRFHSANNIIAFRKAGTTENFIKEYFGELNNGNRIKIKWVDLKESFTPIDVLKNLDSTQSNVVFVASPNESFGLKVVETISGNESYRCTAVGMPTWDGIRGMNSKSCRNVEIVYSTPFAYTSRNYSLSAELTRKYRDKYYSRPSDMVYKGFETTYHFTMLLAKYRSQLINNLSDKDFTLFNQFDIQPVKLKRSNEKPDYMENKKLYFIKKQQGQVKSII
jgi:hypothetical protein